MKRFWVFLAFITVCSAIAVELNGNREHISLNWKNTMAHPAFTVSFKVKMNKKDMVLPASVKNRGRVLFQLNCSPKTVPGLANIKIFFNVATHPAGGYAGIQANGLDSKGAEEKIRYNVYWRAANSQVPTDEFVTVILVYGDGKLNAYLNQQDHSTLHKLMTHTIGYAAPEYQMTFGGAGAKYSVPCAIKDIAIFDRMLTPEEAKTLATGGDCTEIPGILAYYPMENNAAPKVNSPQITAKLHKKRK